MSRFDFFRRVGVGVYPGLLVGPVDSLNLSALGTATLVWVLWRSVRPNVVLRSVGDRSLVISGDQQVDIGVGGVLVLGPISVSIAAWLRYGLAVGDWARGSGLAGGVDILSHLVSALLRRL